MDGTGKDYEKIVRMSEKLNPSGYETLMVFVNTDLETALARNAKRDPTLIPEDEVKECGAHKITLANLKDILKGNMITH